VGLQPIFDGCSFESLDLVASPASADVDMGFVTGHIVALCIRSKSRQFCIVFDKSKGSEIACQLLCSFGTPSKPVLQRCAVGHC
jgi:hypothetical protein